MEFTSVDERDIVGSRRVADQWGLPQTEEDRLLQMEWDEHYRRIARMRRSMEHESDIAARRLNVRTDFVTGQIVPGQSLEIVGTAPLARGAHNLARFPVTTTPADPMPAMGSAPPVMPALHTFEAAEPYYFSRDPAALALERQTRIALHDPQAANVPRITPRIRKQTAPRITWD